MAVDSVFRKRCRLVMMDTGQRTNSTGITVAKYVFVASACSDDGSFNNDTNGQIQRHREETLPSSFHGKFEAQVGR